MANTTSESSDVLDFENLQNERKIIIQRLRNLNEQQLELSNQLKHTNLMLFNLNKKIHPACSCCGRHMDSKYMSIATLEDQDNYNTTNSDGLTGPTAGHWYCGC